MNNLKAWVLVSLVINVIWNYTVFNNFDGLAIFLGMIAYFFSLYQILKIKKLNVWFVIFGVLNILGLVIVLLIPNEKPTS